ncbi:hypothetical protein SMIM3I_02243 [Streptococcus mitis]|uniref:Uncharacterized protein n=1 Tax=Streptococcus mitis TaxID=28037 RepID=A0A150NSU4_STRMT|nr:hypothetical protein SMIM3I_02243 [Streptococcus mitis]
MIFDEFLLYDKMQKHKQTILSSIVAKLGGCSTFVPFI